MNDVPERANERHGIHRLDGVMLPLLLVIGICGPLVLWFAGTLRITLAVATLASFTFLLTLYFFCLVVAHKREFRFHLSGSLLLFALTTFGLIVVEIIRRGMFLTFTDGFIEGQALPWLLLLFVVLLTSLCLTTGAHRLYAFSTLSIGGIGALFFESFHFFLSSGAEGDISPFAGSWSEYSLLAALIGAIAINLSNASGTVFLRVVAHIAIVASLAFLALAPSALALFSVTAAAGVAMLVAILKRPASTRTTFPWMPLAALLFTGTLLLTGVSVPSLSNTTLSGEIRPSHSLTTDIVFSAYGTDHQAVFMGFGPGSFDKTWERYKPSEVNQTSFWASSFEVGYSFIETLAITAGALVALCVGLFLLVFLAESIERMYKALTQGVDPSVLSASACAVLITGIAGFVYTPSFFFFIAMAFALGIFYAEAGSLQPSKELSWVSGGMFKKAAVLGGGIAVVVAACASAIFAINEASVSIRFDRALGEFARGNRESALMQIEKILPGSPRALHHRTAAQMYSARLQDVLAEDALDGEKAAALMKLAYDHALSATGVDPKDYQNWIILAAVYTQLVIMGVPDARELGAEAYGQAQQLSPRSPLVHYGAARLLYFTGDIDRSRTELQQALALKPDYTEARSLLATLEEKSR